METSIANYQVMACNSLNEMLGCPKTQQEEKKLRPQPEQALRCPRCDSTNTKFCYYNNYSLTQPRYFCKACKRYWTQGGSLRNVPLGGACKKHKRSSSSSSTSSKRTEDQVLITTNSNPLWPPLTYDPSDLTLAFATARLQSQPTKQLGMDDHGSTFFVGNPNHDHIAPLPTSPGFLNILRSGLLDNTTTGGFHNNPHYGFGGNGGGGFGGEEMFLPFDQVGLSGAESSTTKTCQGFCKAIDGDQESKVVMGLQWQFGGDGNMAVDSGRDHYWNGVGSSWHIGLTNSSPL